MIRPSRLVDFTDTQLIIHARRGDLTAFSALVERYQEKVVNIVYRLCGDPELANDVAQEAFLRAWQKLHQYDIERPFQNWLLRIATNLTISTFRQAKPTQNIDKLTLNNPDDQPETLFDEKQKIMMVRKAILELPIASRSVLVLREYEGLSYQEIAETFQIPVGTVMSRLNYARTLLAKILKPLMEEK